MIKIKSKRIKQDSKTEFVGVYYKAKNSNNREHLAVINYLLKEILETNTYSKDYLLKTIKKYLEKEDE